jgi:hypothetical protein
MPMSNFQSTDEKRAYYRLLRHLLSEEVVEAYEHEPAEPAPARMMDLLKTLEGYETSKGR